MSLEKILTLGENKRCFECHQISTSVNLSLFTFVCSNCAGLLREIMQFKTKSISCCLASSRELKMLELLGNQKLNKVWLGKLLSGNSRTSWLKEPNGNNLEITRDWIKTKYCEQKYFDEVEFAVLHSSLMIDWHSVYNRNITSSLLLKQNSSKSMVTNPTDLINSKAQIGTDFREMSIPTSKVVPEYQQPTLSQLDLLNMGTIPNAKRCTKNSKNYFGYFKMETIEYNDIYSEEEDYCEFEKATDFHGETLEFTEFFSA